MEQIRSVQENTVEIHRQRTVADETCVRMRSLVSHRCGNCRIEIGGLHDDGFAIISAVLTAAALVGSHCSCDRDLRTVREHGHCGSTQYHQARFGGFVPTMPEEQKSEPVDIPKPDIAEARELTVPAPEVNARIADGRRAHRSTGRTSGWFATAPIGESLQELRATSRAEPVYPATSRRSARKARSRCAFSSTRRGRPQQVMVDR